MKCEWMDGEYNMHGTDEIHTNFDSKNLSWRGQFKAKSLTVSDRIMSSILRRR